MPTRAGSPSLSSNRRLTTGTAPLPGKLGDPKMNLLTDPRTDPRIVAAMKDELLGRDISAWEHSCKDWPLWIFDWSNWSKELLPGGVPDFLPGAPLPEIKGVVDRVETIEGVDGNKIELYISQPEVLSESAPCVVHMHGGGMIMCSPEDPHYVRWRKELASRGLICVSVKFRNASGRHNRPKGFLKPKGFPEGVNDCASTIKWISENKTALQVTEFQYCFHDFEFSISYYG